MFIFKANNYKIENTDKFRLPFMSYIEQIFPRPKVKNLKENLRNEIIRNIKVDIKDKRIAITAGSREIANSVEILETIGKALREKGATPFIINAMGSHGGGIASGQKKILDEYGINEKSVNMEIVCSMETEQIGYAKDNIPIYFSKVALAADGIIVCGRVKPHTDFKGEIESGICKMMAIGLGSHKGASTLHSMGISNFSWLIPTVADVCIKKVPILMGIGIIENAYHETAQIMVIPPEEIIEKEKEMLKESKILMAKLYCDKLDLLIVDEIGKDISGAGMDPNITGRPTTRMPGFNTIKITSIVVLGLTKKTKGHASGLSMADVTTIKVANEIDYAKLYTNSIASACPLGAHLPMLLNDDRDAVMVAMLSSGVIASEKIKIARIKNTSQLNKIQVSTALLEEMSDKSRFRVLSKPNQMMFDENGVLI